MRGARVKPISSKGGRKTVVILPSNKNIKFAHILNNINTFPDYNALTSMQCPDYNAPTAMQCPD